MCLSPLQTWKEFASFVCLGFLEVQIWKDENFQAKATQLLSEIRAGEGQL